MMAGHLTHIVRGKVAEERLSHLSSHHAAMSRGNSTLKTPGILRPWVLREHRCQEGETL